MTQDATPRWEQKLRANEELLRRVLEVIPGGIVHASAEGAILSANEEACRILGLTFDALTQRFTVDFASETIFEDGSPCAPEDYPVSKALRSGERQPPVTIGVKRDGKISWAIYTAIPVFQPDTQTVTGAVVTFLDVTERKRLEQQLVASDRMASLGLLSAAVAHEINNPLTAVIATLDWLDRGLLEHPRLRERLQDAREGAERIRRVSLELGTFARRKEETLETVHLRSVVETSLRLAEVELRHRARIELRFGNTPLVHADASRLGQVLLNLLLNAAHAITPGNTEQNRVLIETFTASDGRAVVEITDTGAGIAQELLALIFDPFVTTKGSAGSGLGLYISQNIARAYGGELKVRSQVGVGSTFSLLLPPAANVEAAPTEETPSFALVAPAKLLVIDDEPSILRVLSSALHRHEVRVASSTREAMELLVKESFSLVLCDLLMPEKTGADLYEQVREAHPALLPRFRFMTGGCSGALQMFLEKVQTPVLDKPFTSASAVDFVERALAALE